MSHGAGAWLCAAATLVAAAPSLAQTRDAARSGVRPEVVAQSISVPVYPGHLLAATVMLPASAEPPVPAVLLLAVRAPRMGHGPASAAVSRALLASGIAVVRLDLPPSLPGEPIAGESLTQPADDAFAVLQFLREREDIDGYRVGIVGIGPAAPAAVGAAALDEGLRALVLLGAPPVSRDTMDLPTSFPLLALPMEVRAAPTEPAEQSTPALEAAAFLVRHLH